MKAILACAIVLLGAGGPAAADPVIERVSVGSDGSQSISATQGPVMSGNGRVVLFHAFDLGNFAPPPRQTAHTGGVVLARERVAHETKLVTLTPDGIAPEGTAGSFATSITDDGRTVVFNSDSGGLLCRFGLCGRADSAVYLRDLVSGELRPLEVDARGVVVRSTIASPAISGDGRVAAFFDLDGLVFEDLASGRIERVPGITGVEPQLSADGRYLVFDESDCGFCPTHCYFVDRSVGEPRRLDLAPDGTPADGDAGCQAAISSDGRRAAFFSSSTRLGVGDGTFHLFVRDLPGVTAQRVDIDPSGRPVEQVVYSSPGNPALSGNGRFIAFATPDALYVRDLEARKTERVDVALDCGSPNEPVRIAQVSISDDGRYIAFVSRASNLVRGDTNSLYDVFVRDRLAQCSRATPAKPQGVRKVGTPKSETLTGTAGDDQLLGGGGSDMLFGLAGDDLLDGGPGVDQLDGGAGADRLVGGGQSDSMHGRGGNDSLFSRDGGRDIVSCGPGVDAAFVDRADQVARDCESIRRS